jgi:hypothetical protein
MKYSSYDNEYEGIKHSVRTGELLGTSDTHHLHAGQHCSMWQTLGSKGI